MLFGYFLFKLVKEVRKMDFVDDIISKNLKYVGKIIVRK